MSDITIKCNFCPSVIVGNDMLQMFRESKYHQVTAHPAKESPTTDDAGEADDE